MIAEDSARRVTPLRIALSACAGHHLAVAGHDPGIGRGALGDAAVAVDLPGLVGAGLARLLLAEHVGSSATDLMSQRAQRMSGIVMTAMPSSARASDRRAASGAR